MRSKRLEDIEKKIADLKAQASDEKRRLSTKERKRETRRKILFTGAVYERLKRNEKITLICETANGTEQAIFQTVGDVESWVVKHLSRPQDFSAFDVDAPTDKKQAIAPAPVSEKPIIVQPEKESAKPQKGDTAVALSVPVTLDMMQGTTTLPQPSTDEDKPPNTARAAQPANSNAPKTPKRKAGKLPEVEQDEMKKQFLM